jgi:acyl-CoA hydrolase
VRLVLCAEGPVEPQAAIDAYFEDHPPTTADPVHLLFGMRRSAPSLPTGPAGALTVGTFLPGRGLRHITPLTYHRLSYSQICRNLADGTLAPDVVIACVTAARADGTRSLGGVNGYLDLAVAAAATIYLEEVAWLPHIAGATQIESATRVVPSAARELDEQPHFAVAFDDVDVTIARRIADLLPASPCLALGIGRVSDALTEQLKDRGDVTVLTGVVTDAVRHLAESGALADGPMRAMSVVGSAPLLRWAASADVQIIPSTHVHEAAWLAGHQRFVAVLGALQVDEHGNVNAETVGGRTVSGRGGAPDFARGAHGSPGGFSVLALHSTDRNGVSRLVESLPDPSMDGQIIDVIVTEKGVADLRGLTGPERVRAVRAIF